MFQSNPKKIFQITILCYLKTIFLLILFINDGYFYFLPYNFPMAVVSN